ncbi:MAG: DUF6737 family protein [Cyanobacteriota bacterium]
MIKRSPLANPSPSSMPSSFNLWDYKPWWCQPWSILLTGMTIISASWLLSHILWLTVIVSILIGLWWIYFLIILPQFLKHHPSVLEHSSIENSPFSQED